MALCRRLALAPLLAALLAGTPAAGLEGGEAEKPREEGEKVLERRPIDEVLKGKVTSFDGGVIEVRYDFEEEAQLEDFPLLKTFNLPGPLEKSWWDHSLHLKGTGSLAWKVVLKRAVEMEFEARYQKALDVGGFVAEERVSDEFTLFSIYDQFFQNKDRRGSPKQHMIARFTMHAPDAGGDHAFRYSIRKTTPPVLGGRPVKVKLGRQGTDVWMEIDGDRMNGGEPQWPPLRGFRPGLYMLENEGWISSVVLRGDVDPVWAKEAGVDLSLSVKPVTAKPAKELSEADRDAQEKVGRVRAGEGSAAGLLPLFQDAALHPSVREDAGKALEETADPKWVPRLVPLMESTDPVCRKVAGHAVTALAGRSFGFNPDAAEESRRKAVRSLLDYIEKNPGKFH